jgi:hypothetical protein
MLLMLKIWRRQGIGGQQSYLFIDRVVSSEHTSEYNGNTGLAIGIGLVAAIS